MENEIYEENKKRQKPRLLLLAALITILLLTGLWFFNRYLFTSPDSTNKPSSKTFSLKIASPTDNLATNQPTVTLQGDTGTKGFVVVSVNGENSIINSTGTFSTKVNLVEGKNTVVVTAFNPDDGESQATVKEILYLNEDLSQL